MLFIFYLFYPPYSIISSCVRTVDSTLGAALLCSSRAGSDFWLVSRWGWGLCQLGYYVLYCNPNTVFAFVSSPSLKQPALLLSLASLVPATGKLFNSGAETKCAKTVITGSNIKQSLMLKNAWRNIPFLFTCEPITSLRKTNVFPQVCSICTLFKFVHLNLIFSIPNKKIIKIGTT